MRSFFTLLFLMTSSSLFAQVQLLNSGTNNQIRQIEKTGNTIFIRGTHDYFAKCYDDCDSIIVLNLPGAGYFSSHLSVIDSQNLYMLTYTGFPHHAIVLRSEDGGYNWNTLWDTSDVLLKLIVMFDTLEGLMSSTFNQLFRTIDRGITWHYEHGPGITHSAVKKLNDSTFCLGTNQWVHFSTDRGLTWTNSRFVQAEPRQFHFLNMDTIFAISGSNWGNYFSHYNSKENSWKNFAFRDIGIGFDPFGLYFKSINEGYVVGNNRDGHGVIVKTTDLFQTWEVHDTGLPSTLLDIKFLNDSIALVSGTGGVLFKWNKNTAFTTNVIQTGKHQHEIDLIPNPTINFQQIKITAKNSIELEIELFDVHGRLLISIYKGILHPGETTFSVENLASLEKGMYLYKITLDRKPYFYKTLIY